MAEPHDRLLRKLDSIATLSAEDRAAVAELPFHVRDLAADTAFVNEGDRPSESCLLLEGLVCSFNLLAEGARQITCFFVPGDMPDLLSLQLQVMDHGISTLTPSRLAFVSHTALAALTRDKPGVAAVLWRETLITGALHRQWVVNTGRRDAYTRIAHLICELDTKFRAIGMAAADGFDMPVTQAELGDATGLSTVHVNRVLQELRADNLIVSKGRFVHIPDWGRLRQVGQFDPTYLHLTPAVREQVAR